MTGMYGADISQLRQLAAALDRAADQLDSSRAGALAAVRSSPWRGPDSDFFRHDWQSVQSARVAEAVWLLREGALRVRTNADDQERTSAVVEHPGAGGRSAREKPTGFTPEQEAVYERALDAVRLMNTAHGTLGDGADLLAGLAKGSLEYKSFADWLSKVKGMDSSALLSLAGMGISAKELGEAIGTDDPAATLESSLDLIMGAVGIKVPGAGLAWDFGKMLGETGYHTLQEFYDSPSSALDAVARDLYGPEATFDNLDQTQRDALMVRYEGIAGPFVSFGDHVHGAVDDFVTWVTTGKARGARR